MKLQFSLNPSWQRELAADDRRLWVLRSVALRIEIRAEPLWSVEVFWKRLLVVCAAMGVAGYLMLVTAVWYWWDRNPRNQVTWSDVALAPVRWKQLERKRGDSAIETALERLRQKDYTEAYYGLRVGLARSPTNANGRVVLARILGFQDPAQALTMLEDGLKYSPDDMELLRTLFGIYSAQQASARALSQAEALMAPGYSPSIGSAARLFLGLQRYNLLAEAGRLPEADHALSEVQALATAPADRANWSRLKIDLCLRRGQIAEAQACQRENFTANSNRPEDLNVEAEIALALKDEEALSIALRRLKVATADSTGAHLLAYRDWHRAGKTARRQAEEKEYFTIYGSDDGAVQALAALAVNLECADTIRRAAETAATNHLSTFAYQVHLTELALRQGNLAEAARILREWEQGVTTLKPEQRFYPEFISQLVRVCSPGSVQTPTLLLDILAKGRGQAQSGVYKLAVESLERAGNAAVAQQVAVAGLRLYPVCEPLAAARDRLQASLAKAEPVKSVEEPGVVIPATAAETLEQIDEALASGTPLRIRELLRAVRAHPPEWLEASERDFAIREVRFALLTEDPIAARFRIETHLNTHHLPEDLQRLVSLAKDQLAANHAAEARLIRDAMLALSGLPTETREALSALRLPDDMSAVASTAQSALKAIDDAVARRQYAEAVRLIGYLRDKKPDWLGSVETELAVREVPLRFSLDQQPLALLLFKELVLRSPASRSAAFKLVRDMRAAGEPGPARLLAMETVRLLPDEPAAGSLLKEMDETATSPTGR